MPSIGFANGSEFVVRRGLIFLLTETVQGAVERAVARHDYHHEGLYVHTEHLGDHFYNIYTCPGLTRLPACCWPKKRSGVPEDRPAPTWSKRLPDTTKAALRRQRKKVDVA